MNHGETQVSVIIPVYSVAQYLRQCLDSVTGQTLDDIIADAENYASFRADHPAAFRIGLAATWLPRKVMGGLRCVRDHDLGYTLRRVLYHLGLWENEDWHL